MDSKKKNVSLRLSQGDIDKVRSIAERLGVKESDILRFAIKQMLVKLAPFHEESYKGVDLMPALLEIGDELVRFFDLGAVELNEIVNRNIDPGEKTVEAEDLKLLALSSVNGEYARMKLNLDAGSAINDSRSFKEYFLNKYFRDNQVKAVESSRNDWTAFVANNGAHLPMPKTA